MCVRGHVRLSAQGTAWEATPAILDGAAPAADAGSYLSAAIVSGRLMVAYQVGSAAVRVVQATDIAGTAFDAPQAVFSTAGAGASVGSHCTLAEVWGAVPWVAFLDAGASQVVLAKGALNSDGSWTFATSVVASSGTGDRPRCLLPQPRTPRCLRGNTDPQRNAYIPVLTLTLRCFLPVPPSPPPTHTYMHSR
jgi:hypothetical protein